MGEIPLSRSPGIPRPGRPFGSYVSRTPAFALACFLASAAAPASAEPFDPEVARRYREVLERDPSSEAVYQRLIELYGEGPGLSSLLEHYEARAAGDGAGSFAVRLVLGKLYRSAGRFAAAAAELEAARALSPRSPLPVAAAAELARVRRQPAEARRLYEEALPLTSGAEARERLRKTLAELALEARDLEAARRQLEALKSERSGDPFVRADVARTYARFGLLDAALAEWQAARRAAGRNAPEVVRALKEVGALLVKLDRGEEAERAYEEALSLVAPGNWNVREIRDSLVEIYRRRADLRTLVDRFERTWKRRGVDEWRLLARLYDETGQEDLAIAGYRKAISLSPRMAELRLALIRLLERLGRIDEVVHEYERLIAGFPRETRYQVELADLLYRRQEPTRAMKLLDRMARQHGDDPEVLAALADAFTRYGENERALAAYKRLVRAGGKDEAHIVGLGEQYALMGDSAAAQQTWRRLLDVVPDRARAYQILGETYASHDLLEKALDAFEHAVRERPDDPELLRPLALAQDRHGKRAEAVTTWERIHELAKTDRARKEARGWIVRLEHALRRLEARLEEWSRAFAADPPDVEAGRLLAEGRERLDRHQEAEETLLELLVLDPNDLDSLAALEELYLDRNELQRAIDVLTRIAALNPVAARDYYQRVAEFSLQLFRDEDAVRFAGLAVDINPADSTAHARLARIYYRMQDLEAAAGELRKAVDLDRMNFEAVFDLARVLRDLGRLGEADRLYRDVVARAPEDEMVATAARKSMHLNLMAGTLEGLERELVPLLWRSPPRPVFRRLVTELYGYLVWPLRERLRHGRPEEAGAARDRLRAVAERGAKPLLEALTDDDAGLRLAALDVLADLRAGDAAVPIGGLLDEREARLRIRAAVALGRIGDARGAPALARSLADGDRGVRAASAWALGEIGGRAAADLLVKHLRNHADPQWSVRAVAAAALGKARGRRALPVLLALVSAPHADTKEEVRAAACWALGRLDDPRGTPALLASLELDTLLVRRVAALALGGRDDPRVTGALVAALWTGEPSLREAALWALGGGAAETETPGEPPRFVHLDTGQVTVAEYVDDLSRLPAGTSDPSARAAGLERVKGALRDALLDALTSDDPAVVRQVLEDLDLWGEGLALGPVGARDRGADLQRLLAGLLGGPSPVAALTGLAGSDSPELRRRAVSVLGKLGVRQEAVLLVLAAALEDAEPSVRLAGVAAAAREGGARAVEVLQKAAADAHWSVRAEAVGALGRLGDRAASAVLLARLADDYASVRTAAAGALGRLSARDAVPGLTGALADRAGAVRAAAAAALGAIGDASALPAVEALRADESVLVRDAAKEAAARLR